jgi:molybdate transport system regulatory protein
MNQIAATVTEIQETDVVTYIGVDCGGTVMRLIKSKTPEWLDVGDGVYCTFQEASVCVSKDCPGQVSIENRLPAKVAGVRQGASLCELTFDSDVGSVVSLITAHAYDELGLQEGSDATILIRGIDINVEPKLVPVDLEKYASVTGRTKDA